MISSNIQSITPLSLCRLVIFVLDDFFPILIFFINPLKFFPFEQMVTILQSLDFSQFDLQCVVELSDDFTTLL